MQRLLENKAFEADIKWASIQITGYVLLLVEVVKSNKWK